MLKKGMLCILMMILITGCSAQTGKKELIENISKLEQSLNSADLEYSKLQVKELKQTHGKNEWKLQLLGDEGEYERLNEAISRLIVAVEAEEITDAKLELATIRTIVEDIYTL